MAEADEVFGAMAPLLGRTGVVQPARAGQAAPSATVPRPRSFLPSAAGDGWASSQVDNAVRKERETRIYMRRLLTFAVVLALVLPSASTVAAQPVPQEYTANLGGEPDKIDPNASSFSTEASVITQVFETLLTLDPNLVPQAAAADRYEVSADGLTYWFYLRPDGMYSDGVPVRAQDFEYSFKRLLDPATASDYASLYVDAGIVGAAEFNSGTGSRDAVGVRALDDTTLQVDLVAPFAPFLAMTALWVVSPVRQDLVDAYGDAWATDPATFIGNGPFMMSEWSHQERITFVRNPYYRTQPVLEKLTYVMVTDAIADFAAYVNGEREQTGVPDAQVNAVLNDPVLSLEARRVSELVTFWIHLNNEKPPLNNPVFRQALSKAIDRQAMIRDIANGVGRPTTSLIPPGMPGFQEGLGAEYDFDPAGAQQLLRDAGFADGSAVPLLTYSYSNVTSNQRRAEFIQAQLRQNLGIEIVLNPMESKAFQAAFKAKNYEMAFGGWGADYPDPQNWFNTNFGCKGGNNKYNFCDPGIDQLVARADTATDLTERLIYYAVAQDALVRAMPVVFLFNRERLGLFKPYVENVVITASDYQILGDRYMYLRSIAPH